MRNERIVPRMRTIGEAIRAIREADPGTAFTERALRRLVVSGAVPSVKVGAKYLVNLDLLLEQLTDGITAAERAAGTVNGIRKIAV